MMLVENGRKETHCALNDHHTRGFGSLIQTMSVSTSQGTYLGIFVNVISDLSGFAQRTPKHPQSRYQNDRIL